MTAKKPLTYKDSGVDIDAGNELVKRIAPAVKKTRRSEVMGGLGGFGGLFELDVKKFQQPVLVSGTDGVGTKLKLALALNRHETIGIDLVAMCVNDILVSGAEPQFFLDYYATAKLDIDIAEQVICGIAKGCELAGAALIGGETAEMPGMYQGSDYDLAGFAVGVAEKSQLINGQNVRTGDQIIGLSSSGPHANGYSLIRHILSETNAPLSTPLGEQTLADALIAPTRIYVKSILKLLKTTPINAMAHITGGGLLENIPRVLPTGHHAKLDRTSWQRPEVFDWLQQAGNLSDTEIARTFNDGIGFCLIVSSQYAELALQTLIDSGEKAQLIGEIIADTNDSNADPQTLIQ